jgi:hypothetical protein
MDRDTVTDAALTPGEFAILHCLAIGQPVSVEAAPPHDLRSLLTSGDVTEEGGALILSGLLATFDDHAASRNRWASRSSLARPYI